MKHLGDVSKINGAGIEPVDVITFGSPCQDLSVAGNRAGLHDGERSNLFFEAVRIIKEMREATNNEYPKYAVWENVPGAFSSNKGRDFHAVLEALCSVCDDTVSIPKPYDKRKPDKLVWNKAGEIVGGNYSVAWRTLDAQYWGAPQRRKRIYLVADFGGRCAGEILFKPDSLRGDSAQGNETGQGSSVDAVGSVDGSVGVECVEETVDFGRTSDRIRINADKAATIQAGGGGAGAKTGLYCFSFDSLSSNSMKSSNPFSGCRAVEIAKCIDTTYPDPSKNQGGVAVVQPLVLKERAGCDGGGKGALWSDKAFTLATNQDMSVIALQANGIDRADTAGCNGCGWRENESYTLNTIDRHAVCYDARNHNAQDISGTIQAKSNGGQSLNYINPFCYDARGNGDGNLSPTITGDHQNRITDYTAVAVFEPKSALEENWGEANVKNALRAGASKSSHAVVQETKPPRKYIIRRLTPTECQRLQGFPNIVEVDMTDITRDELVAIALSAGYIKVNIASGEVFATRGPGGMERDTPVLLSGANVNGYKVYSLHANGVKKQIRANRLVWIAAHEAIPDGMVVDHINNDKKDNRIENLQLLTPGENSTKAREDGLYLVGDDSPNAKTTEVERKTISFLYWHTPMPFRVLAEHYGISESRAHQIIHEYNWSTLAPYDPADAEFWEDVRKTHAEINGKKYKPTKNLKKWYEKLHTDSAEYKAYGNGLALPCAEFVIHSIAEQGAKTLGSLFDGIGGFPLAGVLNGIKPVWASEVEPYCIAVTKSSFKE